MGNYYIISIKDGSGVLQSLGITSTTMQHAIDAAKSHLGLATDSSTDVNVQTFQLIGKVDVAGE